ncbi:hypothetical protein NL523_28095, partial [Klebsiella pneumoniae]|nr:hypothetical protein [Klebsiella pneumoniae]MCP6663611.1 hypothetical protein [Klebsiella pneumoniae]
VPKLPKTFGAREFMEDCPKEKLPDVPALFPDHLIPKLFADSRLISTTLASIRTCTGWVISKRLTTLSAYADATFSARFF